VYFGVVLILRETVGVRLEHVVLGWAIATLSSVIVSVTWVWRRTAAEPVRLSAIWDGWGRRLRTGFRAFLAVGLTLLLVRADVWMLRPLLGVASVGQISVATYLAEWMWYVPGILGNLIFAIVAADSGLETVLKVTRSARMVALLMFGALLFLIPIGQWLVPAVYGKAYTQAGMLFVVLLPGTAALAIHLI